MKNSENTTSQTSNKIKAARIFRVDGQTLLGEVNLLTQNQLCQEYQQLCEFTDILYFATIL